MQSPNQSQQFADQFFLFQAQLEQSALHYTTAAMRQLRMGYHQIQNQNHNHLPQWGSRSQGHGGGPSMISMSVADQHLQQQRNLNSSCGGNGTRTARRHSNSNRRLPPVPPVINVTMMDGSEGDYDDYGGGGGRRVVTLVKGSRSMPTKGIRKVNFAHPLSMIKIKSPTPVHSLEDFGSAFMASSGSGGSGGISGGFGWTNKADMRYVYSDSDTRGDEKEVEGILGDDNDSTFVDGDGLALDDDGGNGGTARQRRRKRRKKRKHDDHDNDQGGWASTEFDSAFVPELELTGEDPYAIYEVQLNPEDYEFVSEVRLCTEEDFTRDDSDSSEAEKGWESTPDEEGDEAVGGESDVLVEMQQLYGDIGSQRINQMEEAIEEHFAKEVNGIN